MLTFREEGYDLGKRFGEGDQTGVTSLIGPAKVTLNYEKVG